MTLKKIAFYVNHIGKGRVEYTIDLDRLSPVARMLADATTSTLHTADFPFCPGIIGKKTYWDYWHERLAANPDDTMAQRYVRDYELNMSERDKLARPTGQYVYDALSIQDGETPLRFFERHARIWKKAYADEWLIWTPECGYKWCQTSAHPLSAYPKTRSTPPCPSK